MANGDPGKKTCFVVMGFNEKTDYHATPPRVLDLNKTFKNIIEPAVEESGLECIRADRIIHSTVIDKPMYEHLLEADLVIADLSTSNANAIYELGVRHALRPHTTIVMAENGFAFPFDLNHLTILKYEHLGKDIGYDEVMRMRGELKKRIAALVGKDETDSPVFLFLPSLLGQGAGAPAPAPTAQPQDSKSLGELVEAVKQAKAAVREPADWLAVVGLLERMRKLQPTDPYVIQQLALATYKSRQPDVAQSLRKAGTILAALEPEASCDVETVGLWGAIHKRLFEVGGDPADLGRAIRAYARGFFIRNDYYNGINFAFLLNLRAAASQGDDAVADRILARRIREEVLTLCDAALLPRAAGMDLSADELFWVKACKVEALLGLGRTAESDTLRQQLLAARPVQWMVDSLNDQLTKLTPLNP
jgi:MAP3K TRAFs-binding domain